MPEPVALGIRPPPDAMTTMGGMMNIANTAQAMQQRGVQIQQQQMDLQERQNLRQLTQQLDQYKDEDGEPDYPRLADAAIKASPKLGAEWLKNIAGAHAESLVARRSLLSLKQEQRDALGKTVESVAESKPEDQEAVIRSAGTSLGVPAWADIAIKRLQGAGNDPKARAEVAHRIGMATATPTEQAAIRTGTRVGTGGEAVQVSPTALSLAGGGPAAKPVQMTLPPTAETVDEHGQRRFIGAPPGAKPAAPIAAGAPLGLQATEEGKAAIVKQHFGEQVANVGSASLLEGIAQNIKSFAPKAIVGTEQERLAFVNGILEKMGVGGASDLKTATDKMEKNMNQLVQNSPAATDAARVVRQLASPHPTMNAKAINDSADQIIGQVRMSKDLYKTFLPHVVASDVPGYLKKLSDVSDVTDARIWQFEAANKEERKKMVAEMRPEDRASFKAKIMKAEQLGFFK